MFLIEKVFLNEEDLRPKKFQTPDNMDEVWFLDNGASNHMTGKLKYFS